MSTTHTIGTDRRPTALAAAASRYELLCSVAKSLEALSKSYPGVVELAARALRLKTRMARGGIRGYQVSTELCAIIDDLEELLA